MVRIDNAKQRADLVEAAEDGIFRLAVYDAVGDEGLVFLEEMKDSAQLPKEEAMRNFTRLLKKKKEPSLFWRLLTRSLSRVAVVGFIVTACFLVPWVPSRRFAYR